jgi:groucho
MYSLLTSDYSVPQQGPPPQPGQLKFTVAETCERIKEEFNFLQAQYHS